MAETRRAWEKLKRSRLAVAGALLVLSYFCAAAFADLAPRDPKEIRQEMQLRPPSGEAWLGTDALGRDLFSRVLHGARYSLFIGVVSVGFAMLIGVPLGLVAGEARGVVDAVVMRFVDILLAFPGILLAVAIVATLGPSLFHLMIAVAIVNVPVYARQVRASVLQVRELDYVVAARALGAGRLRVIGRQILPNVLAPVLILATLGLGTAILEAAGLGFVGLGVSPEIPEWGNMLEQSRAHFVQHPWTVFVPGVAISVAILGFNLLGDALRDALDPRASRL